MTRTEYDLTIEYTDPKIPEYTRHFELPPNIQVWESFIVIIENNFRRKVYIHEREVRSITITDIEVTITEGEVSGRPEPDGRPVPLSNS